MSAQPDITLYTFGTPNGLKASVALEELGVPYKAEIINIMKNTQKEPWFLEINPNGRIPAIKDGNLRVFESGAIILYLADKYDTENKISFPHGSDLYYEALSWIIFHMAGVGPNQGQAGHFVAMAKVKSEYGIQRFLDETKRLYSVLESRLKDNDWLVGDKFSIADIANFTWVRGADLIDIDVAAEYPGVKRWLDRIEAREGVQKGLKVGAMRTPEQVREMYAGMKARVAAMGNSDKQ